MGRPQKVELYGRNGPDSLIKSRVDYFHYDAHGIVYKSDYEYYLRVNASGAEEKIKSRGTCLYRDDGQIKQCSSVEYKTDGTIRAHHFRKYEYSLEGRRVADTIISCPTTDSCDTTLVLHFFNPGGCGQPGYYAKTSNGDTIILHEWECTADGRLAWNRRTHDGKVVEKVEYTWSQRGAVGTAEYIDSDGTLIILERRDSLESGVIELRSYYPSGVPKDEVKVVPISLSGGSNETMVCYDTTGELLWWETAKRDSTRLVVFDSTVFYVDSVPWKRESGRLIETVDWERKRRVEEYVKATVIGNEPKVSERKVTYKYVYYYDDDTNLMAHVQPPRHSKGMVSTRITDGGVLLRMPSSDQQWNFSIIDPKGRTIKRGVLAPKDARGESTVRIVLPSGIYLLHLVRRGEDVDGQIRRLRVL
jgi:hypothetical protein